MKIIDLLSSNNYQKVLFLLVKNNDNSLTEKEITEIIGVSKSGVNSALKELEKSNLISRKKRGKLSFWFVNDLPLIKELKKTINLAILFPLVEKLKAISQRVILFGSLAKGEDTKESDIDLFILTDEKEKVLKEIRKFTVEQEIKPVILSPLEYATSKNQDKTFYEEVARGIALYERDIHE